MESRHHHEDEALETERKKGLALSASEVGHAPMGREWIDAGEVCIMRCALLNFTLSSNRSQTIL
jgi:hypothetical protein